MSVALGDEEGEEGLNIQRQALIGVCTKIFLP